MGPLAAARWAWQAVADPSRPQVIWSEAPGYTLSKLNVPSSRQGDSPDRIYRVAALDPRSRSSPLHRNIRVERTLPLIKGAGGRRSTRGSVLIPP